MSSPSSLGLCTCSVTHEASMWEQETETNAGDEGGDAHFTLQLAHILGLFGLQSFRQFGVERQSRLLLSRLLVFHLKHAVNDW